MRRLGEQNTTDRYLVSARHEAPRQFLLQRVEPRVLFYLADGVALVDWSDQNFFDQVLSFRGNKFRDSIVASQNFLV